MNNIGEVVTRWQEVMLVLMRLLSLAVVVVIIGGILLLLGVYLPVAGTILGIVSFVLLLVGVLEVDTIKCPSCKENKRILKNIGSYQCSNCGQKLHIQAGTIRIMNENN